MDRDTVFKNTLNKDTADKVAIKKDTLIRRLKIKLLYSYAGIITCGIAVLVLFQLLSLILFRQLLVPRDILRIFTVVSSVLTVFMGVSCVSLLRHEGFQAKNTVGVVLGIGWIAGNLICLALSKMLNETGLLCRFAELFGCYVNFILSGMLLAALIAAKHKPAYDKDFVIIPGCSISKQGGLLPLLKGRTNRAIRFAWDQERATEKQAHYIPTGGQGPDEIMSEGSAMEFYLLSHGAEQNEVLPEKASFNTHENMLFSKKIIDQVKPDAKVCFVTTNFHVLRSGILARKVGLDAEGLASVTKWYFWPNALAREIVALFSMYWRQQAAALGISFILALIMK